MKLNQLAKKNKFVDSIESKNNDSEDEFLLYWQSFHF